MREKIKLTIRNLIFLYIICHFIIICFIIFQFKIIPLIKPKINSNKKPLTGLADLYKTDETLTNQFFVYFKNEISKNAIDNKIENFIKTYDIKIMKEDYISPYYVFLFEAKSIKDAEILLSLLKQDSLVSDAFPRVDIKY